MQDWYFDEHTQKGTDYNDIAVVEAYDREMGKLRDIDREVTEIIDDISLQQNHIIADIGCGTGKYSIAIAKECQQVYCLDVSDAMLAYAKKQAKENNINNIQFIHNGFLDYSHHGPLFDSVISQLALHHLPDFWKMVALRNIHTMLHPGGCFYLKDLVFSVRMEKYEKSIDYTVGNLRETAGDNSANEFINHVRSEFSTYDWIMEEMLYRAGFDIEKADYGDNFVTVYVCKKVTLEK